MKKKSLILILALAIFLTSFVSAQEVLTFTDFTTGSIVCSAYSTGAFWNNSILNIAIPITDADANCNISAFNRAITCCPTSKAHCNTEIGKCEDGNLITDCSKYHAAADCEIDDMDVGIVSVENSSNCGLSSYFVFGGELCTNKTDCGCFWEGSATGHCSAKKIYTTECPTSGGHHHGNCTWSMFSSSNQDCQNINLPISIFSSASWTGSGERPTECRNISRTYPCVSVEKLPFFTFSNLLVSLLTIAVIYGIIIRKK